MPRTRTLGIVFLAVALLAAAGFAAMRERPRAQGAAAPPAALEFTQADLYTVQPATLERSLPLTGTLVPFTEATVKAKLAGELVEVAAREGQSVARGQVLARIDPTEARARVAARQADVEAARAQLVWAEKNQKTQKALLERNFISQNAFDNVQSNFDVAAARLRAAEADLVVAQKALGDAVLAAPFAGIVAERHAQPGERVALDAKVVTVVDLARMQLEAPVPASEIARVRVGQPVSFRVEGFGEREFSGRIERISPATVAGSRSISIYAVIDNPDRTLRKGMFAQGSLLTGRVEGALVIPAAAVREEAGQAYVYALEGGRVKRKAVRVGPAGPAGSVQVLQGLDADERIVRNNLGTLREGAEARLAGPAPGAAAAR